jgi:hypothetical protein
MGHLLNALGELFWKEPAVSILVSSVGILMFGYQFLKFRSHSEHRGFGTAVKVAVSGLLIGGMLGAPVGVGAVAYASRNHCASIAGSQQYLDEHCWGAPGSD